MTDMNENIKKQILAKIEEYDKIIICRHIRPDGDAVGSTKGLAGIIKNTYPAKKVYVVNDDHSQYLSFLGGEDELAADEYIGALGITVDTGTLDRASNKNITLCKEIIKIDHHVDITPYGDISWVEDWRSSACEMIADFWYTFKDKLKMTKETATYIFCGMVTDSGRFQYDGVDGDTLRLAGALLDYKIDTQMMYAHLYMEDFSYLKFKAYVYEHMNMTENGVAYIYVDHAMQEEFALSQEDASAIIGELSTIKGSLIWIAFIDNADCSAIRVRLRSRFLAVDKLGNKYHGGGHEMAAGATVYSIKEMNACIADADKLLGEYKKNNTGWL